jgi:hypothetical protein
MATSLSTDLKEAYCQALEELPAEALALVARARVPICRSPAERDQALAAIVLSYRAGPRRLWAPVLLGLLGPALLERLQGLRQELPVLEEEDLRQLLVVELLHLAATLPLRDGRYLKRRLLRRANQAVRRWLEAERHHQSRHESYEVRVEAGR